MSTLFKNADILIRKNGKIDFVRKGYLGIDGTTIDYISDKAPEKKYDVVKDMSGKLLIPGMVNTHTHTPMTHLRGLGSGQPLQKWLYDCIIPVEDKMDDNHVLIGTQFAILEMLAGGITCYQDMYWNQESMVQMLFDSGIKLNTGAVVFLYQPDNQAARNYTKQRIEETEHFFKNYNLAADGRIHVDLQLHSEYAIDDYFVEQCSSLIHEYNMPVHIHVSETKEEHNASISRHNMTPIAYLNEKGLLDTGAVCAHCVWASDDDLEILLRKGATISHNPTSNLKMGSGIAPITKALAKGVNIALGTDGTASNNNLNIFEEMHIASIIHNGYANDALAISAQQAFDMATINGSKALHRDDTGELAIGKRADIVALDMDRPHLLPDNDTLALLVYSAQASDVCMTMVDGRILYENGEYLSIDAEKCKAEFLLWAKKLME